MDFKDDRFNRFQEELYRKIVEAFGIVPPGLGQAEQVYSNMKLKHGNPPVQTAYMIYCNEDMPNVSTPFTTVLELEARNMKALVADGFNPSWN